MKVAHEHDSNHGLVVTADALQGGALRCSNCTEGFMTHRPILRNKDDSICSKGISDLHQNVLSILLCEGRLEPTTAAR